MMGYTKGPWKWEDSALVDESGYEVIGIFQAHGDTKAWLTVNAGGENDGGNQTLIQAAPDMYEALKELEWSGIYEWGEYDTNSCCPVCETHIGEPHKPDCILWKALSKAEGRL